MMNRTERNIVSPILAALPQELREVFADWRRVFFGGIDPLRPSAEISAWIDRMKQAAMKTDIKQVAAVAGPSLSFLLRGLHSQHGRHRLFLLLRAQPHLMLGDSPIYRYLAEVEVKSPLAAIALTPSSLPSNAGPVLEYYLKSAAASDGEARWTHLKRASADLFVEYERSANELLRAEALRTNKSISKLLQNRKPTFGNVATALEALAPPIGHPIPQSINKIRNAFSHGGAVYKPDTDQVSLNDEKWTKTVGLIELLQIFEATHAISEELLKASVTRLAEHIIDNFYRTHSWADFLNPATQETIQSEIQAFVSTSRSKVNEKIDALPR